MVQHRHCLKFFIEPIVLNKRLKSVTPLLLKSDFSLTSSLLCQQNHFYTFYGHTAFHTIYKFHSSLLVSFNFSSLSFSDLASNAILTLYNHLEQSSTLSFVLSSSNLSLLFSHMLPTHTLQMSMSLQNLPAHSVIHHSSHIYSDLPIPLPTPLPFSFWQNPSPARP